MQHSSFDPAMGLMEKENILVCLRPVFAVSWGVVCVRCLLRLYDLMKHFKAVQMGPVGQGTPKRQLIKDNVCLHAACYCSISSPLSIHTYEHAFIIWVQLLGKARYTTRSKMVGHTQQWKIHARKEKNSLPGPQCVLCMELLRAKNHKNA